MSFSDYDNHRRMSIILIVNTHNTFYNLKLRIKTHSSESRGQEEAGCMRQMRELFTRSTAVKFVNALNKPPLKLLLSYLGLSTF